MSPAQMYTVQQLYWESLDYTVPWYVMNYRRTRPQHYISTGEILPLNPPLDWQCAHTEGHLFWQKRCCLPAGHAQHEHDMKKIGK